MTLNNSNFQLISHLEFLSHITKKKLISIFENEAKIEAVFLFGSAVKNQLRKESDLDFGILVSEGNLFSGMELLELSGEIECVTKFRADLGIISKSNLIYSKEAILSGIRIFDRDPMTSDRKINLLLSMYYHFKDEMREIYNAYRIG